MKSNKKHDKHNYNPSPDDSNVGKSFPRRIDLKLILSVVATGLLSFFGIVIETAMNVTFPTLMHELTVNTATVQWLTTGYLLMLALTIPLSAYLKARYRLKSLFIVAGALFLAGSVLGWLTPNFGLLLTARLLQGVSTGIALPLMFNIVIEQSPTERLGLMMGVATLLCALSPAVGPSFGGLIIEFYGWRTIFLSLVPVVMLSLGIGIYAIRQSADLSRPTFDYLSYGFLLLAFSSLLMAMSFAGDSGFMALPVRLLLVVFIISTAFFAKRTYLHPEPFIRLDIFDNFRFALSSVTIMLIQFICLGLGFLLPNFAQLVQGTLPFDAGAILLPGCLIGAIIAPVSGRIFDAIGAKKPLIFGSIAIVIATVLFWQSITTADTKTLMLIYIVFAVGLSFVAGNILTFGVKSLPANRRSDGNAAFNTLQQLAGALGTAIIATIVATEQKVYGADIATGTLVGAKNAVEIMAVVAVAAFIIIIYVLSKRD